MKSPGRTKTIEGAAPARAASKSCSARTIPLPSEGCAPTEERATTCGTRADRTAAAIDREAALASASVFRLRRRNLHHEDRLRAPERRPRGSPYPTLATHDLDPEALCPCRITRHGAHRGAALLQGLEHCATDLTGASHDDEHRDLPGCEVAPIIRYTFHKYAHFILSISHGYGRRRAMAEIKAPWCPVTATVRRLGSTSSSISRINRAASMSCAVSSRASRSAC